MDTESTVDTETIIDSADDGIFADISSAGEQEIEQRCLQNVGKYSNSFNAYSCYCYTLILVCCTGVNTDLGMQDLSKIQKQFGLTRRQISVTC